MKKLISIDPIVVLQFLKFSVIGLLNTGIHYAVFYILFRYVGLHYLAAAIIGYSAGMTNSFLLNKHWTFLSRQGRIDEEIIKFVIVNLTALLVNIGLLRYFVEYEHIIPEVGQMCAIGFSLVVNFIGNKYWTFPSISINR